MALPSYVSYQSDRTAAEKGLLLLSRLSDVRGSEDSLYGVFWDRRRTWAVAGVREKGCQESAEDIISAAIRLLTGMPTFKPLTEFTMTDWIVGDDEPLENSFVRLSDIIRDHPRNPSRLRESRE